MKYLLILLLTLSANVFAGECPPGSQSPNCSNDYPGVVPNWASRYSVGCSMTDNETGAVNYEFRQGNTDYAQGGSMMLYLQQGLEAWYQDVRALVEQDGTADMRLIPTPDSPLTQFIAIEADLVDR